LKSSEFWDGLLFSIVKEVVFLTSVKKVDLKARERTVD
jgi:hypothetical protein